MKRGFLSSILYFLYIAVVCAQVITPTTPLAIPSDGAVLYTGIGDSRQAQLFTAPTNPGALSANQYQNVANFLLGNPLILINNLGISGKRTDEYFNTNLATALADTSQLVILNECCVNDISQASGTPYVNTNGVSVTITNVAAIAEGNVETAAKQLIAAGKRVIIVTEPGATTLNQAQVGAVYEVDQRERAFVARTPNVKLWDLTPCIWNQTSSASAIAFAAGVSGDGTHRTTLGGSYEAMGHNGCVGFAQFIAQAVLPYEQRISNISEVFATSPLQLVNNPLFITLAGGATSGSGVLTSGTVPANWNLKQPLGTTSTIITSVLDPNGFGNDITLTITFGAADTVSFYSTAPSNANWALSDIIYSSIDFSTTGGTHCGYQLEQQRNVDSVTPNWFANAVAATGDGPNFPYAMTLQTLPQGPGGTVQGFLSPRFEIVASAATTCTVTVSRMSIRKRTSMLESTKSLEAVA